MATANDTEPSGPTKNACRHCGRYTTVDAEATPDWLCPKCERFQQQIACPTCHQPTIISMVPADVVPEPVAPVED